jgi:4-carboxymuconolactone decarboxylase
MSRLSRVDISTFSAEQKALYDSIVGGPRGKTRRSLTDEHGNLTGPFGIFLHNPALGNHWSAIGETLRFGTKLERRLFELAILVIATHWRASHEWAVHAPLARAQGISDDVLAALKSGARPTFARDDEATVYAFVRELAGERRIIDATYAKAKALLGEDQLVELANACGYYIALAAMMTSFEIRPPKDLEDPWPAQTHE